jgi:hypothetical protein
VAAAKYQDRLTSPTDSSRVNEKTIHRVFGDCVPGVRLQEINNPIQPRILYYSLRCGVTGVYASEFVKFEGVHQPRFPSPGFGTTWQEAVTDRRQQSGVLSTQRYINTVAG